MRGKLTLRKLVLVCCLSLLMVAFGSQAVPAMEIFSSGMLTPETISASIGGYPGAYLIPDATRQSTDPTQGAIWAVPADGNNPTKFATNLNVLPIGGLFLPNSTYWGTAAGEYLTVGYVQNSDGSYTGAIDTYSTSGAYSVLWSSVGNLPKSVALAPAGWGSVGGQLVVTDGGPSVYAIDPSGKKTQVENSTGVTARFGLAFAPAGWGTVGGNLLTNISENGSLEIFSVKPDGTDALWASTLLKTGQSGPRQMAFSPAGFIPGYGQLLFVSVSGSAFGGGSLGDILVYDSDGNVVASLRTNLGLDKFDPRGLYFTADGELLISDASDPILIATASDFQAVPIPPSVLLLGTSLLGLLAFRRKRGQM
jgi:hypothetical protein